MSPLLLRVLGLVGVEPGQREGQAESKTQRLSVFPSLPASVPLTQTYLGVNWGFVSCLKSARSWTGEKNQRLFPAGMRRGLFLALSA